MAFRTGATVFMLLASVTGLCHAEQTDRLRAVPPDRTKFVPPGATVLTELSLNFGDGAGVETVIAYASASEPLINTGLVVLSYDQRTGWTAVFRESDSVINGAGPSDSMRIETLTAQNRKEGLLVILRNSGAGTATEWHVLAAVGNKISKLNPAQLRNDVLRRREYQDMGYNGVKAKGDLVIEDVPGYSLHTARCCPNRPSLKISFRYTGDSIVLDSVHDLPYGEPKSGPHGPLLHLNANGFWAYGYPLADGFLLLGGSEAQKGSPQSMSAAIVSLRNELLDRGVLADAGDYFIMMSNYKLPSASVAAEIILAGSGDAHLQWRDANARLGRGLAGIQ